MKYVALLVVSLFSAGCRADVSALPPLPDLSTQPASVRTHLTAADRAAREQPRSAQAVGALCLAYHADMLYEQADQCYAIVEPLSGGEWRWTYYRALVHDARGDADALIASLQRVVSKAPTFSPAWWRLGEAAFKAGRNDAAQDAWQKVLSLPDPARPAAPDNSPVRVPVAPMTAYAGLGLARCARRRSATPRSSRESTDSKRLRSTPTANCADR